MAPAAAHATEGIVSSIDVNAIAPFWRRTNGILLYFLLTSSLLASAALGIDGVGGILHDVGLAGLGITNDLCYSP